jgi:hypothetical protein
MGTVAFGSLIIALIQMARLVLEYIKRKYSKDVGRIGRWIMCCFSCCLWCLEKCMKYVQMHLLFPHPLVYSLSHALAFCNAPHSLTNPLFHPPSRTPTRPTEFTLPPFIFRPHRPASTSCIMQCGLTTEKLHSPPPPPPYIQVCEQECIHHHQHPWISILQRCVHCTQRFDVERAARVCHQWYRLSRHHTF